MNKELIWATLHRTSATTTGSCEWNDMWFTRQCSWNFTTCLLYNTMVLVTQLRVSLQLTCLLQPSWLSLPCQKFWRQIFSICGSSWFLSLDSIWGMYLVLAECEMVSLWLTWPPWSDKSSLCSLQLHLWNEAKWWTYQSSLQCQAQLVIAKQTLCGQWYID